VDGFIWAVGALLGTLVLAFLLKGMGTTQGSATAAVSVTLLGGPWIGFGLGAVLLVRDIGAYGRVAAFAVVLAVFADDTLAYFGGRLLGRHKLAPTISPGKTWEGFFFGTAAAIFVVFVALYQDREDFLTIGESPSLGVVVAGRAARRPLRVHAQTRHGREGLRKILAGSRGVSRPRRHHPLRLPGRLFRVHAFLT
jgi:phosphatidate cytidylyltransferase